MDGPPSAATIISELTRAKAEFQLRAILAAMGVTQATPQQPASAANRNPHTDPQP